MALNLREYPAEPPSRSVGAKAPVIDLPPRGSMLWPLPHRIPRTLVFGRKLSRCSARCDSVYRIVEVGHVHLSQFVAGGLSEVRELPNPSRHLREPRYREFDRAWPARLN